MQLEPRARHRAYPAESTNMHILERALQSRCCLLRALVQAEEKKVTEATQKVAQDPRPPKRARRDEPAAKPKAKAKGKAKQAAKNKAQ